MRVVFDTSSRNTIALLIGYLEIKKYYVPAIPQQILYLM